MLPRTKLTSELLRDELVQMEHKHQMSSSEFIARFHEGKLSEEQDFMRWAWLCAVAMRKGLLSVTPAHA